MSSIPFPAQGGKRFRFANFGVVCLFNVTNDLGECLVVGTQVPNAAGGFDVDGAQVNVLLVIKQEVDAPTWNQDCINSGGQGSFLVKLVPMINLALRTYFTLPPPMPDEQNVPRYVQQDWNDLLYEWLAVGLSADGTCPQVSTRATESKAPVDFSKDVAVPGTTV